MPMIVDELIDKTLRDYGVIATPAVRTGIYKYISLLLRWNEQISLTTITDTLEILQFHFGESMFAASVVPIREGRLADVGSGAGFPGIPLKLLIPSLELLLIESNTKKSAFLEECVRELDLKGVNVHRGRFEDLEARVPHFDFITARALGDYFALMSWAQYQVTPCGALVLWLGGRDATEIQKTPLFGWRSAIPIPRSERRVLLIGAHR